ncbi:MAG: hypothetical protein DWQ02_23325 [Bacteroidetes bacterium]|nr:MAG: hypothetical protein DWQ02_23325 [Bacteroidota bacterium]
MDPRQINIETIEAYFQGKLSPSEQQTLENEISSNPDLASEIDAYRKIFTGLDVLGNVSFKHKLEEWSEEWKSSDGEESMLIEAYLKDDLHPDLNSATEERIKSDPDFAKKVEQYKTIISGLNALESQEFKGKMKTWEAEKTAPSRQGVVIRPLFRRMAIAASFLLVVSIGLKWYATTNFGPNAVIEAAYFRPETGGTMGSEIPEDIQVVEKQFASAHDFMENQEYEMALEAFDNVLMSLDIADFPESRKDAIRDNTLYSIALAQIAMEEEPEEIQEQLNELISTTSDSFYKSKAEELLSKLDSFWFKLG